MGDRVLGLGHATYAEVVGVEGSALSLLPEGLELTDAAAIPLVVLTGDQLVILADSGEPGQTVLVSGAVGSVGRAAVHSAKKRGIRVIAGVRTSQLEQANELDVFDTIAIDNDDAVKNLSLVDAIADTVGGATAAKLLPKVKNGGRFCYASALPEGTIQQFAAVKVVRVFARPNASTLREFALDIRDHRFTLPISQRLPLWDAGKGQQLAERGGAMGTILLVSPLHQKA